MNNEIQKYYILYELNDKSPVTSGEQTLLNPEVLAEAMVNISKEVVIEAANEYNAQIIGLKLQELYPEATSLLDKNKVIEIMGQDPAVAIAVDNYNAKVVVDKHVEKVSQNSELPLNDTATLINPEVLAKTYGIDLEVAAKAATEFNSIIYEKKLEAKTPILNSEQTYADFVQVCKTYNIPVDLAYLSAKKR